MRKIGSLLTLLCSLIALGLVWVGCLSVFDEYQVVPDFESTPREGWDYWMRLEFWHDVRAFSLWVLMAVGGLVVPAFGLILSWRPISLRKATTWLLIAIAVFYLILWSWGVVQVLRLPDPHWIQISPFIMFAGCLYGLLVLLKRAFYQIDEEAVGSDH